MADYLSLEEAAKKLGIPTDRLVELRSQGRVRGFRDGASWKFPEDAIDNLADDLSAEVGDAEVGDDGGSGLLVDESEVGASLSSGGSNVIGGDVPSSEEGSGSDLELGNESLVPGSGSDVDLVPSEGEGSDVAIVASDSDLLLESGGDDLLEIDSAELQLDDRAIMHDSGQLDLAIEPNAGSTGPVTDEELNAISESHPDVLGPEASDGDLNLSDEDSGEDLIGDDEDSAMDVLGSDASTEGSQLSSTGVSSLELMEDLDSPGASDLGSSLSSRGADVLSEIDLLGSEKKDSGLLAGESDDLLASSGLGSSIGADALKDSDLGGLDDALADDDDLVIADDDDDLVISSAGSDISVAGDSGINLMSPSDSGLSLESEPLDLAGSSISALDLGAELSDGGSGSGSGSGSGKGEAEFQADEEFQLSPSGVGLDADFESGSQVIEVEDSEAIGEPVEFGDAGIVEADPLGGDVFAEADDGDAVVMDDEAEGIEIDRSAAPVSSAAAVGAYEVPFTLLQCITLMLILCVLSLGGMLMTDLVRNMWTYSEQSAPVSSLTDSLIGLMGW